MALSNNHVFDAVRGVLSDPKDILDRGDVNRDCGKNRCVYLERFEIDESCITAVQVNSLEIEPGRNIVSSAPMIWDLLKSKVLSRKISYN